MLTDTEKIKILAKVLQRIIKHAKEQPGTKLEFSPADEWAGSALDTCGLPRELVQ